MEIFSLLSTLKGYGVTENTRPSAKTKRTAPFRESSDTLSLSEKSRHVASALESLAQSDISRQEKINALKALVDTGQYEPDVHRVAQKLATDHLHLLLDR